MIKDSLTGGFLMFSGYTEVEHWLKSNEVVVTGTGIFIKERVVILLNK